MQHPRIVIVQRNMAFRLALALTLAAAFGAAPARADMFTPSRSDQVKLGKRAADEIRQKSRVLPPSDPRVQVLRDIGSRLIGFIAGEQKMPWEYSFDLISDKSINAFALPGGPVFFYSGLLDKIKTEDQLAGVLAHELTHVRKEHWAHAYADSQRRSLGISLLLILFNANRTFTDLASITNDLVWGLPFSRKMETEADDVGYELMVRAGYNPQGMADVFQILRDTAKGGKSPEFLNTHPDDKNRIKRIDDKIVKSGKQYPPQRALYFGMPPPLPRPPATKPQ